MEGRPRCEDEQAGETGTSGRPIGRRAVLAAGLAAGGAALATTVTGCRPRSAGDQEGPGASQAQAVPPGRGRLQARPGTPDQVPPPPGLHPLDPTSRRGGLLFVPAGHRPEVAAPVVVTLHGAGGDAAGGIASLRDLADGAGLVLVAPESRGSTWDVIGDDYGPDVAVIDQALGHVFARMTVDARRIAIEGFSDGASYALSLGLGNADLFTHCIAFSPGFVAEPARRGRLRAFVTHGVHDPVLPIDRCSRRIVTALRRDGYDVTYTEFDGAHVVPPDLARAAVAWLVQPA